MIKSVALKHFRLGVNFMKAESVISVLGTKRHFCEYVPKVSLEKSFNHVTLLGRVGVNPQLRGTESRPVVMFTLATNTNYKYESGEIQQKTDWHRISVFKPYLRNTVLEHLKKGSRVFVEGRILYGEYTDAKSVIHNTVTIVANDVIFVGSALKKEDIDTEVLEEAV